ncbi:peptidylprolyl isomerase [Devosia enhydra]|uniref:Peptidyl-prolyl cis-trans isomerase n=1 Tax=Devosia enhydra TaxID=665118 RepID=A0A1K2HW81_9HYPH|nr:peptidylprolyl isomerase [Devosia enhydra]SFZ82246.1 peptidylprolyl isomerase [Devosia enhydra]
MTSLASRFGRRAVLVSAFAMMALGSAGLAQAQQGNPHLLIAVEGGTIDIALRPDLAPQHVERIVTLAGQGFYDGVVFHRVIADFMAQTGDPTGTGAGGSELPDLPAEFSSEPFVRGVVGAARTNDPNSANSQFFIVTADSRHLDGAYTVFGTVVSGMELVDGLEKGAPPSGMVANPDRMISARIEYRN